MRKSARMHAILISGEGEEFEKETAELARVLILSHTSVSILVGCTPQQCIEKISEVVAVADEVDDVILIGFCGHGSSVGWNTAVGAPLLTYESIVDAVITTQHTIQLCAATCYAQYLIKEIIGRRSGFITSILVPAAFGDGLYFGTAFTDIANAWEQHQFAVDSRVSYRDVEVHNASAYGQTIQHWGVLIDHRFFPKN